jgi:hypothetical protein
MSRLIGALVVVGLVAAPALAHPFHTTVLEADWVPAKRELQASLRVDPEALNLAITAQTGAPLVLAPVEGPRPDLAVFVDGAVVVTSAAGARAAINYRGHKVEKDGVWLFFVVELSGGMKGATLLSQAFLGQQPKQLNAVLVREGDELVFSKVFTGRDLTPAILW